MLLHPSEELGLGPLHEICIGPHFWFDPVNILCFCLSRNCRLTRLSGRNNSSWWEEMAFSVAPTNTESLVHTVRRLALDFFFRRRSKYQHTQF